MKTLLDIINENIGKDASPKNKAPNSLACAETVSTMLQTYFKQYNIDFPIIIGTYELWREMQRRVELFERVYEPRAEDVVISATNTNTRPELLPHGHVGCYIDSNKIVSNDSATGNLIQNFTRETWRSLYHYYGGYPVYLYRIKSIIS